MRNRDENSLRTTTLDHDVEIEDYESLPDPAMQTDRSYVSDNPFELADDASETNNFTRSDHNQGVPE